MLTKYVGTGQPWVLYPPLFLLGLSHFCKPSSLSQEKKSAFPGRQTPLPSVEPKTWHLDLGIVSDFEKSSSEKREENKWGMSRCGLST